MQTKTQYIATSAPPAESATPTLNIPFKKINFFTYATVTEPQWCRVNQLKNEVYGSVLAGGTALMTTTRPSFINNIAVHF